MLLLDGVRRAFDMRITALAGLAAARAAAHFRSLIGGYCSYGCRAPAAAFRSGIGGDCTPLARVLAGSTGAAGSGVQRFWRRFSSEIRLVASLGIVSGPSRGVPKEFGFFDPQRKVKSLSRVFFIAPTECIVPPIFPRNSQLAQLVEHQSPYEDTTVNLGVSGSPGLTHGLLIPLLRATFLFLYLESSRCYLGPQGV